MKFFTQSLYRPTLLAMVGGRIRLTCAIKPIGSVIHYIGLDFLNYTIGMGLVIRIFFYRRDETLDRDIQDQNFEFSHNQTTIKRKDLPSG